MKITDYRSEYWPQLEELWVTSWKQAMPQIDFDARRGWFNAHVGELLARDYAIFCALDEDKLLGFVIFNPDSGHLDQIAVAPNYARQGIGRALLKQVRSRIDEITLDVNIDNEAACAFYKGEAFEVIGEGVNTRSGLKTLQMRWTAG